MCRPSLRRKYKFCSSSCSATYNNDRRELPTVEQRKKISDSLREKYSTGEIVSPNRKTKLLVTCKHCGKHFLIRPSEVHRKFCSKACSNKGADFSNNGGFREHSGTSKRGWYKGVFCGSSWELAWVIFQMEHFISFERNRTGFPYIFEGKRHKYYPDFKVGDEYIEIKGYKKSNVDAKVSQFPSDKRLRVLYKEDLRDVFDYVIGKYGKTFYELYDN